MPLLSKTFNVRQLYSKRVILISDLARAKFLCQSKPLPCQNVAIKNYSSKPELTNTSVEKMRLFKRIGAGILFSATLALALYSKRKKTQKLKDSLEDCQRLHPDPNYSSSIGTEFYRCNSCIFPGDIAKSGILKQLKSFELKEDDVIVASFPKSGTTWMQEIVYLIQTGLDFASAQKQVLESRFPYLEYPYPGLATIKKSQGPRLIKTHLPLSFLPTSANEKGTKIIYIIRNPKDVVVSYYYFLRMATFLGYRGRFAEFIEKFIKGDVPYGPYFNHVLGYWKHYQSTKDESNILWISYEEMHRDPEACIRRVADFLGKQLTDAEIRLIAAHTRFDRMAANPSVNYSHWDDLGLRDKKESHFMRKGKVGDWRQHFDAETNRRFDAFIHEHLQESGLHFEYLPTNEAEEPYNSM